MHISSRVDYAKRIYAAVGVADAAFGSHANIVAVAVGSIKVFLPPKQTGPWPKNWLMMLVAMTQPAQSTDEVTVAVAAVSVQPG